MEPLVRIERRITSLHDLLSVVTAMRSLAGMRVREARQTLLGVQHYLAAVQRALAAAVPLLPPEGAAPPRSEGATAVFVFGSEHGFVGALNDHLVEMALRHARGHEDSRLFVVGSRGVRTVRERRVEPAWTQAMATRTSSIIDVARRLADELYRSVDAGKFSRVVLVYAASEAGSRWEARSSLLLPFDPSPYQPRQGAGWPPLHYLPPERLIEKLIEELVFAELLLAPSSPLPVRTQRVWRRCSRRTKPSERNCGTCKGMQMFNDRRRSPPNSSTSLPAPKRSKSDCESPHRLARVTVVAPGGESPT